MAPPLTVFVLSTETEHNTYSWIKVGFFYDMPRYKSLYPFLQFNNLTASLRQQVLTYFRKHQPHKLSQHNFHSMLTGTEFRLTSVIDI